MKLFTSTLITAAAALTLAGAAQAQVTVTTGGGYIKMVEALTAQYEKDTGAKVEKAFGGNIGYSRCFGCYESQKIHKSTEC